MNEPTDGPTDRSFLLLSLLLLLLSKLLLSMVWYLSVELQCDVADRSRRQDRERVGGWVDGWMGGWNFRLS